MRTAKSSKFIFLIITMALALIACFTCYSGSIFVKASNPSDANKYFNSSSDVAFKNDGVSASLEKEGTLSVKNTLVLNALGIEVKTDSNLSKLGFSFVTSHSFANGYALKDDEGKEVVIDALTHNLLITFNGSNLSVKFNGESATATLTGNLDLVFKVVDNVVYAYVEGVEVYSDKTQYLVNNQYVCEAYDLTFVASELVQGASATELTIMAIDQNVNDSTGEYKQTFTLKDGEIEKLATPYGVVENNVSADGEINVKLLYVNTFSLKAYSIFEEFKSADLMLSKADATDNEVTLGNVVNPKTVVFSKTGVKTLNISTNRSSFNGKILGSFEVNVYNEDIVAPVYDVSLVNSEAYQSYLAAVNAATKTVDSLGNETHIKLGDKFYVPSLSDFISDNYSSYGNLTATVCYKTPSQDLNTIQSFEIPVEEAGDYVFFVVFGDTFGNVMEQDDFYTIDEEDENKIEFGKYGDFVFSFHIEDDAEFDIDGSKRQGKGFIGEFYTATSFNIIGSNYSAQYELFYNVNSNAVAEDEGWERIIRASELTDDYSDKTFSSDDIKNIAYDGKLSFTPDRAGAYKIVCTIVSDNASRVASAETVIYVSKTVKVKNYEPLETREIFAIVFLSVGGLCLVGIIALIFVKPKEETTAKE